MSTCLYTTKQLGFNQGELLSQMTIGCFGKQVFFRCHPIHLATSKFRIGWIQTRRRRMRTPITIRIIHGWLDGEGCQGVRDEGIVGRDLV